MAQVMVRRVRMGRKLRVSIVAMALAAVAGPVMGAEGKPGTTVESSADLSAIIAAVAAQIRAEIKRLPADSSVETFEASILFVADQAGQPESVICAAFDIVKMEPATPSNAKPAMENVCRQLKTRRGTGAIGNSNGQFAPSGFSAPVISTGGGSSNYTQ